MGYPCALIGIRTRPIPRNPSLLHIKHNPAGSLPPEAVMIQPDCIVPYRGLLLIELVHIVLDLLVTEKYAVKRVAETGGTTLLVVANCAVIIVVRTSL